MYIVKTCQCSVQESRDIQYTKIYAPFEVLSRYAEIMKYRMPIKQVHRTVFISFSKTNFC